MYSMNTVSIKLFHYNTTTKSFFGEMAELSRGGDKQVFNDYQGGSHNLSVIVKNDTTGNEVEYVVTSAQYDPQHEELIGWYLAPTVESELNVPECKGTTMFIVND